MEKTQITQYLSLLTDEKVFSCSVPGFSWFLSELPPRNKVIEDKAVISVD